MQNRYARVARLPLLLLLLCTAISFTLVVAQEQRPQVTIVEDMVAQAKPPRGTLGTGSYKPTTKEAAFFDRLTEDERRTGSLLSSYSITGKQGKFVGWFGIVRGIEVNQETKTTKLLIEHRYSDGLTDTHMMTVSSNGGGDFQALLAGTDSGIIKELSLVKVYGIVESETTSVPKLTVEYARHWDWGLFNFMTYGSQKGNKKWQKLNKAGDKDYSAFPDRKYYEERLGKRKP